MSTVKFVHGAFRKGVNDALTLAPLRDAIGGLVSPVKSVGKSVSRSAASGKFTTDGAWKTSRSSDGQNVTSSRKK